MEDELQQTTTTQQDHDPNGAPPGLADIAAICAASEKLRYGIMPLWMLSCRDCHTKPKLNFKRLEPLVVYYPSDLALTNTHPQNIV